MALMLKMLNVMSHVDPYLHVHHPRCLLCMSIDVIPAGWQETLPFNNHEKFLWPSLKISEEVGMAMEQLKILGQYLTSGIVSIH